MKFTPKQMWLSFAEGFVGAFQLTFAIVMAVVAVSSAFVHGNLDGGEPNHNRSSSL